MDRTRRLTFLIQRLNIRHFHPAAGVFGDVPIFAMPEVNFDFTRPLISNRKTRITVDFEAGRETQIRVKLQRYRQILRG